MRTTSSWWLLSMAEVFRRLQLPVNSMFSEAGISIQSLAHPNTRFPQDGVTRLWEIAEAESGNDHIGLLVGKQLSITGFPVLGYSLITASGLTDGLQRFLRYQRMIGESSNIQMQQSNGQLQLDLKFSGDEKPVSPHTVDAALAALVNMGRLLAGESWCGDEIRLRRKPPKQPELFVNYFQCPVRFNAQANQLFVDMKNVANTESQGAKETSVTVPFLDKDRPTAELVEMLINMKLQDGDINREYIARQLNITPRTLQRRLEKEGESYQSILDKVRHQKALSCLANPQISQIEVAFLCGFSDLTAFHHAFKRWQNQTPGEYRRAILE